jgi:hypothetical protein
MDTGFIFQGQRDNDMALNTHLHPVVKLKKEKSYTSARRLEIYGQPSVEFRCYFHFIRQCWIPPDGMLFSLEDGRL